MFTQIDKTKTEFLRKKIQQMKEEKVEEAEQTGKKKLTDLLSTVLVVLLRISFFFGAQYYVLAKLAVDPFTIWQSTVIYLGISAVVSLFKKST